MSLFAIVGRLPRIPLNWWRWITRRLPRENHPFTEVYIALTFGIGPRQTPGRSNEQCAQALARLYQAQPRPIIAQQEVYQALRALSVIPLAHLFCIPSPIERQRWGLHRHSSHSVDDALALCRTFRWKRGILVGHRCHMPRVVWYFQRQRFCITHVETTGIGYCPDSTQRWCRGPIRFCAWELCLAIPAYTLLGKI